MNQSVFSRRSDSLPSASASPNPGPTPFPSPMPNTTPVGSTPHVSRDLLQLNAAGPSLLRPGSSPSPRVKPSFSKYPTTTNTSDLLERVRDFLPRLQESNENLTEEDQMNIVEASEGSEPEPGCVEMDLAVGVLDVKPEVTESSVVDRTNQLLGLKSKKTSGMVIDTTDADMERSERD